MAKPIFLMGFPSSVPPSELERIGNHIRKQIDDYHVLVVRNTEEKFIAKVYSEKGADVVELDKIEKLLKKKL